MNEQPTPEELADALDAEVAPVLAEIEDELTRTLPGILAGLEAAP